jgi:ABC-type dipeptide/oligopeptide/nickel transport systems, permease components
MLFVLFGISMPPFFLGLILAYVFGFKLGWTPISDYCNFFPHSGGECNGPARWAYHLILPWVSFMVLFAALYVRLIRAGILEVTGEDYVRTARAKGASGRRVVVHHILRNSMLPVVTVLGMDIALAFGGALFIEEGVQPARPRLRAHRSGPKGRRAGCRGMHRRHHARGDRLELHRGRDLRLARSTDSNGFTHSKKCLTLITYRRQS